MLYHISINIIKYKKKNNKNCYILINNINSYVQTLI